MKRSSCRNPARHVFLSWAAVLQMLLIVALLGPHSAEATQAAAGTEQPAWPLEIRTAEFALDRNGPWQSLQLPDTWAKRQLKGFRQGHYRARFTLAEEPTQPLGLRIDRLSRVHEIRINGHVLQGNLQVPRSQLRRPVPAKVMLPAHLLVSGTNVLEVSIDAGARAGLSPLIVADQLRTDRDFEPVVFRYVEFPQFLNVATISIALFLMLLWSRRRRDLALGLIAGLSVLASLRNLGYFMGAPLGSQAFTDWVFFSAQSFTAVLLGVFALHFSGRSAPRIRRLLWAVAVAYPVLGAASALFDHGQFARSVLYPGLFLLSMGALALIVKQIAGRRTVSDVLIVFSMLIVLGAAIHDYLYQSGYTSIMDTFWIPYATPVVLLAYLGTLSYRLIDALNTSDQLAQILETKVAERTAELEASNQAKSRYLAAASHDLRQPLVSIGLLSVLLREQALPAAAHAVVSRLQSAVENMEALFNRVLDFARLDAKAVEPKLQAVDVQPMLEAIASHTQEVAEQQGLRLRFRPTPAKVVADPLLLEQILRNLISNAMRYTVGGSVLVCVRRAAPGTWRIEVRDSGPGIAPADQEQIFKEFVRLPRASAAVGAHDQPGLGLGLAISRQLARLMGTELRLRSAPGRGSCFSVRLPAADDAGRPTPMQAPKRAA